jgi:hypothetical protein
LAKELSGVETLIVGFGSVDSARITPHLGGSSQDVLDMADLVLSRSENPYMASLHTFAESIERTAATGIYYILSTTFAVSESRLLSLLRHAFVGTPTIRGTFNEIRLIRRQDIRKHLICCLRLYTLYLLCLSFLLNVSHLFSSF